MTDEKTDNEPPADHHHTVRERVDAARAAAEEVVAEESGQLGGEVNALALPFEEAAAAVRAAIHPDRLAENEVVHGEPDEPDGPADEAEPSEKHPAAG
jgi:hypothetical protein